ncbi:MAG: dihydroorotase [Bdellovibrionota bacterium]
MSPIKVSEANSFVLTNVTLVDPAQGHNGSKDIWIEKGVVKEVCEPGALSSKRKDNSVPVSVDGQGLLCVPGLIDVHTHLREPGFEYKETIATGTLAAAAGGFTSVLCMANTNPVNDNPYVTQFILAQSRSHAHVRVFPVGALSKGLKGEQLAEIGKMKDAGIVAVSDDGIPVMNSYLMRKALDYCKSFDLTIISHAEDANLVGQGVMHEGIHSNCLGLRGIPAESEEILVARDIALARLTRGRVHFAHISTRQALAHIRRAKQEGLAVSCEVTPHHLCFTDEDVGGYNSNFKMAPPLRTGEDVGALKGALQDGTIDCIATDHAPHAPRDKDVLFEFASNGVVGLETAWSVGVSLVHEGILTVSKLVEILSLNPARLFNIPGGSLKPGSVADFMLSDFDAEYSPETAHLQSRSKNSPFLGKRLRGRVVATFVGGVCKWNA